MTVHGHSPPTRPGDEPRGLAPIRRWLRRGPFHGWQREHAGLRRSVAQTRSDVVAVVKRLDRKEAPSRAARRGRKRLEALEHALAAHFAAEEGEGHLEQALQMAPRFANQAERLRRDHGNLMREIRELRELARNAGHDREAWVVVYRSYDSFAEKLELHDQAENEIMTRAVLEDIGPGD